MFSKLHFYPKHIFFITLLSFFISFSLSVPVYATSGSTTAQQPSENTDSPVDVDAALGAAFDDTTSNPTPIITETPNETPKADAVSAAEVTQYSAVMFVTGADTLNVRSGPSSDNDKIGSYSLNEEVNVTGKTSNGWYQVDYNGSSGYVASEYLTEISSATEAPTETPTSEVATTEAGTESEEHSSFQLSSITDLFTQFSAKTVLIILIVIVFVSVLITTILLFRKKDTDEDDDDEDEDDEYEDDEEEYEADEEEYDEDEDDIPVKNFKQPIYSRKDQAPKAYHTIRNYHSSASKKHAPEPITKNTVAKNATASTPKRNGSISPKATFQFYDFDSDQDEAQSLAEANAKIKKLQAEIDYLKKR